ncbi:MAG: LysR family transcriptional regulator [Oscillospiraceae bacterium]|nr:LysR family transcriptional regulator [Oscillospiraceae bacterium]
MTVTQVRYVCEIAKSGSMTKAANRFFISQPALSEQMKALEAELGCTLFRRTARGTELTEAGERFCREAEPVVRIWEKFERSCTVLKEMPWGTARIGFGLRARSNGLFEPTVGFVDSYPDVSFSMITDMHENFPDAVASGRLDVAIERVYDSQLSGLIDRVAMFPLLWEPQCILMSRTDPLRREASLPIRVLDGKTAVCGPVDSGDDWEMKQLCARDGVRLSRVLRADDINAVMALVQRGKGYALGPVSFAEYFGVAAVPLEPKMEVALYLVCRKEERNSALIRRLQKHLKESLLQHLAAD